MHPKESWCESSVQCDGFSGCLQFDVSCVDGHKVFSFGDLIQTIRGPDTDAHLFLRSMENVTSALLMAEKLSHTIGTMALTGHVQCSWWADALKASFVWVQRGSSLLSISLSQVIVSKKGKRLLRHKTAPRPARRLPTTRPLQHGAPADSWLLCLDSVLPIPV